jgi:hypothetical protein
MDKIICQIVNPLVEFHKRINYLAGTAIIVDGMDNMMCFKAICGHDTGCMMKLCNASRIYRASS